MKVLLYGDFYLDTSGFAKELKDLIPELLKQGHEVRQIGLRYNGFSQQKPIIPVYHTRIQGVKSHWSAEIVEYAIKDFQPDILFSVQDYFCLPYLTPVLSKPFKKPFKWIHWGLADGEPINKTAVKASAWVHHHIFQSDFARDALEKGLKMYAVKDTDFSNNEVIFPAIDLNTFYPLDKDKMKKEIKLDKRFVVFFLARNQFRKNIPCLMEAVKKLSKVITNIQLLIQSVDTVTPDLQREGYNMQEIVEYLDIQEYIAEVKGSTGMPMAPAILNKLYNASDIFCVPTMGEGFGLIFQEAMATGLPCISTNYSAVPEVLGNGRGILVNPAAYIWRGGETKHAILNSDDLANAIFKVWENPVLREKMSKAGLDWVKKYTPDKVADKLNAVFERVIKEDPQPLAFKELA